MRELKFRAWHYDANQIIYESYPGEVFQWLKEKQLIDVMQYTDLKDKNGKEIYEGDIVKGKHLDRWNPDADMVEVSWNQYGAFYPFADAEDNEPYPKPETVEVIGNAFENPGLLKGAV